MPTAHPLIVPSVLPADFARVGEVCQQLEAAGVDRIQWDVMDGQFVPNLTFGPDLIAACRAWTTLPFEAHLMVAEPDQFLPRFVEAGEVGREHRGDDEGVRGGHVPTLPAGTPGSGASAARAARAAATGTSAHRRRRATSNARRVAALATFSDSTPLDSGIRSQRSTSAATGVETPVASFPST